MTSKEAIERLEYIKAHHTDPEDYELFDLAIKALEERQQGELEALGFVNMKYAWCRCSICHKTTKIYLDSSNEFCCISDIRKKVVACLYCGADMRQE